MKQSICSNNGVAASFVSSSQHQSDQYRRCNTDIENNNSCKSSYYKSYSRSSSRGLRSHSDVIMATSKDPRESLLEQNDETLTVDEDYDCTSLDSEEISLGGDTQLNDLLRLVLRMIIFILIGLTLYHLIFRYGDVIEMKDKLVKLIIDHPIKTLAILLFEIVVTIIKLVCLDGLIRLMRRCCCSRRNSRRS